MVPLVDLAHEFEKSYRVCWFVKNDGRGVGKVVVGKMCAVALAATAVCFYGPAEERIAAKKCAPEWLAVIVK